MRRFDGMADSTRKIATIVVRGFVLLDASGFAVPCTALISGCVEGMSDDI